VGHQHQQARCRTSSVEEERPRRHPRWRSSQGNGLCVAETKTWFTDTPGDQRDRGHSCGSAARAEKRSSLIYYHRLELQPSLPLKSLMFLRVRCSSRLFGSPSDYVRKHHGREGGQEARERCTRVHKGKEQTLDEARWPVRYDSEPGSNHEPAAVLGNARVQEGGGQGATAEVARAMEYDTMFPANVNARCNFY